MSLLALGLVVLGGCGRTVDCSEPGRVLAEAGASTLTCHEAGWAVAHAEVLAGRRMGRGDRRLVLGEVAEDFEQDPAGTLAWLEKVRGEGALLAAGTGVAGAEKRAAAVYRAHVGDGVVPARASELRAVQKRTLSVWATDEASKLALTEADMEAWIHFASLCREIQGGSGLRISVSDRVAVYRMIRERFEAGSRDEKVALSHLGAVWPAVMQAWPAASYETQQRFVSAAPLPPPMTATSLGYAEAVFEGDVVRYVAALTEALGPFTMSTQGPMFQVEVPAP